MPTIHDAIHSSSGTLHAFFRPRGGVSYTSGAVLALIALSITALRPDPIVAQRSHADSAKVLSQMAMDAHREGSRESLEKSLPLYHQALVQFQAARDTFGEGATLVNIGTVRDMLGNTDSAIVYYDRGIPLLHSSGNLEAE